MAGHNLYRRNSVARLMRAVRRHVERQTRTRRHVECIVRPDTRVLPRIQPVFPTLLAKNTRTGSRYPPLQRRFGQAIIDRAKRLESRCRNACASIRHRRAPSQQSRQTTLVGRLAKSPAAQQHALHFDHRVPGTQRQPQADS